MEPMIDRIKRHNGVAGQFSYTVEVTYPGEDTTKLEFVGHAYGDSVIMCLPTGAQIYVWDPSRFGDTLSPTWVKNFFQ